jgi:hypothetical protein
VVRNKSRLVAQGFSQKEGIDYEETFALVARLEAIRILLAFSVAKGFKLHQMDVKSAFLNGVLEEEVYVRQPPGFESEKYPHRVYKLRKALYGLKQAPRLWYGRLRGFLFERGFEMGKVDQTLFLLRQGRDILIVQVYVEDIVFDGSSNSLVARFADDMSREFEMSMMSELQFFLGLQIKQSKEGTFVHQAKYTKDIVWYVCALVFKCLQGLRIGKRSSAFSGTCVTLPTSAFGTPRLLLWLFMVFQTWILPGVGWIGSPLLGLVSFWDLLWCLGLPANSRVLLNPLPRQSTLPQLVVALSSFGSHTP